MRSRSTTPSRLRRAGVLAVVLAAASLACASALAEFPPPPASPSQAAAAALRAAMRRANLADWMNGSPCDEPTGVAWRDPYSGVLSVLRRDGPLLPARSQARTLARIAEYLCVDVKYCSEPKARKVRGLARNLLRRAVKMCPRSTSAWAVLAYTKLLSTSPRGKAAFSQYLAMACRSNPVNPGAQYMRAQVIFGCHSRVAPAGRRKAPFGNARFTSPRWARAYCYRGLMCLEGCRTRGTVGVFGPGSRRLYKTFLLPELKYYEPKQLAEEEAGTWKPDPSADPWPPKSLVRKALRRLLPKGSSHRLAGRRGGE